MSTLRVNNLKSRTGTAVTITSGHSLDVEGGLSITGNSLVTGVSTFSGITSFTTGANVTGVVTFTDVDIQNGNTNFTGIVSATTFHGNITGTAATFTGVLTYEDVTNVDSVGVVTARQGIRVGSGKSIGADVGTVTYYGSGIGVTSLNAGELSTGTVPVARLGTGTPDNTKFLRGDNSWQVVSSGTYSPHAFDEYSYHSSVTQTGRSNYYDISGGNTVTFTPTSTNDIIFFNYGVTMYQGGADRGAEVYLMMKAGADTIGSGDTKLDYFGQHTKYINQATAWHDVLHKSLWYPCTGLTVGTAYYVEVAGAIHNSQVAFNHPNTGDSGYKRHFLQMMHYKKN